MTQMNADKKATELSEIHDIFSGKSGLFYKEYGT